MKRTPCTTLRVDPVKHARYRDAFQWGRWMRNGACLLAMLMPAFGRCTGPLEQNITQVEIDVAEPLLSGGGCVAVLPTETQGMPPAGRPIQLTVTHANSVVKFRYPADQHYDFHFLPLGRQHTTPLWTEPLSAGSGSYIDPQTHHGVNVADEQFIMLPNKHGDYDGPHVPACNLPYTLEDDLARDAYRCERVTNGEVCTLTKP
jgi:hypothetical protein